MEKLSEIFSSALHFKRWETGTCSRNIDDASYWNCWVELRPVNSLRLLSLLREIYTLLFL